ncbi:MULTISPECIES: CesT family type III secretion system chaperone [unclassified Bordetella]|uniref:CesT family type III secretion system chaperone n=1 Tax=unclassified Bordetella TaxID=2630031 RepID=UPI00132061C4|nr:MULTISPECIES: CesT family type III secretion system chaperone [unclassified Bordetella]MVW70393.1 hypothetical protein [Bordetella sp. 15P40C-2]MVW78667.1 hypothetical protein [Bordetella sp. 02P26C-1]
MHPQTHVLAELGERLGVPLSFGESGQCCIVLDQELYVAIETLASGWLFTGLLGQGVDNRGSAFLQDVLSRNLKLTQQYGGTIACEPQSGALLYVSKLPLSQLDGEKAYEFLEQFVDQLESLSHQLQLH